MNFDISWDEVAKYAVASPERSRAWRRCSTSIRIAFCSAPTRSHRPAQAPYFAVFDMWAPVWKQLTPEASRKVRKGNYERLFDAARTARAGVGASEPEMNLTSVRKRRAYHETHMIDDRLLARSPRWRGRLAMAFALLLGTAHVTHARQDAGRAAHGGLWLRHARHGLQLQHHRSGLVRHHAVNRLPSFDERIRRGRQHVRRRTSDPASA